MDWIKKLLGLKKEKQRDISNVNTRLSRPPLWQPKVYILQKDLPMYKAGIRFQQTYQSDNVYFTGHTISANIPEKDQVGVIEFEAKYLENNPEWFAPENVTPSVSNTKRRFNE